MFTVQYRKFTSKKRRSLLTLRQPSGLLLMKIDGTGGHQMNAVGRWLFVRL